ncbi:hypothetical protein [Spiroplasma endosymbiont of Tricholauxania praeusta]
MNKKYCKRCDYPFSNSWYTQKYDDNICTDCCAEEGEWNEELEGSDDEDD